MITKIVHGHNFNSCIKYVLKNPSASLLCSKGVRHNTIQTIATDFNIQLKMNRTIQKPVGHLIMSWHRLDLEKLTSEKMISVAKEFLAITLIQNTQYIIVRHQNRPHPHLHIIFNRVNNNGKVISDSFSHKRYIEASKMLTQKHQYNYKTEKSNVNRDTLWGLDKLKYELFDIINWAKSSATNWDEFRTSLEQQDVSFLLRYHSDTSVVQGISFRKGKTKFKGSSIDKSLCYSAVDHQLNSNKLDQILCRNLTVKRSQSDVVLVIPPREKKIKRVKLRI
jgi:hypothetical protein